ncbi:probable L-type lectin-domain containing receptor kinase S.7 [Phalaenopsis equestris]|uniref:probable L-type lectin-domain containing receptor kinase S.7 n=1 Tax=Phalaenopsis equestris TaxID=78828 RepID=UPI0009E4C634|nr:probable L-type lectin-domain containing receptor kinase S.7 [Phalaenopsis equestris]
MASSMKQERTYSILILFLCVILLRCPISSLQDRDDYAPPFFVKNITFIGSFLLMNESRQLSTMAAVVFFLRVPFHETKANSTVSFGTEPVLAVEFAPLFISNYILMFKNGVLDTPGVIHHRRNKYLTIRQLLHHINRIKKPILSAKSNFGFSASTQNRNGTNLEIKDWSFQIISSDTSQFEFYGNKDIVLASYTPVLAVISLFSAFWSYFKKIFKDKEDTTPNPYQDSSISSLLVQFRRFTYSELSSATNFFHQSELLGEGIVASVYRASFPGSINTYAVRRFNTNFSSKKCYETEVRTIHSLRHQNILELRGWCNENPNEPLLVYDYMPNRSLFDLLSTGKFLLWPHRFNIVVGIAKALVYLHHECNPSVIHSDIKEEKVLLDAELNPKLADFGLSLRCQNKLPFQHNEWATPKIDVFLFGSFVLGLCCRRTEGYMDFIGKLRKLKLEDRLVEAADENLVGNYNEEEMLRLLTVGLECMDEEIAKRPSMAEVLKVLLT